MKLKSVIMDEAAVVRSMTRITHEIIEKNSGVKDLVLLGIRRRGVPLAKMLRTNMERFENKQVPAGSIDISLYRDDLTELSDVPTEGAGDIPCDGVFVLRDAVSAGRLVPGLETEGAHVKVRHDISTNLPGLFACGDIAGKPYQLIKAAGQGNTAALSLVEYLQDRKK